MNAGALRVLAALRSHGSVTPRSFRAPTVDGGDEMDRVAARINELRDAGHQIETVMETSPKGKRYARYFLREAGVSSAVAVPIPPGTDTKTTATAPETPADTLFDLDVAMASPYDEDVAA